VRVRVVYKAGWYKAGWYEAAGVLWSWVGAVLCCGCSCSRLVVQFVCRGLAATRTCNATLATHLPQTLPPLSGIPTRSLSRPNKHANATLPSATQPPRHFCTAIFSPLSFLDRRQFVFIIAFSLTRPSVIRWWISASPSPTRSHPTPTHNPPRPPPKSHTTRSSRACPPIASTFERRGIGNSRWLRLWPQPPRQCPRDPRRGGSRPPTPILGRCDVCLPTQKRQGEKGEKERGVYWNCLDLTIVGAAVKVSYSFDEGNKNNCLARWPHLVTTPVVQVDRDLLVGAVEFKTCILSIISGRYYSPSSFPCFLAFFSSYWWDFW
jgi:hypothetical protein